MARKKVKIPPILFTPIEELGFGKRVANVLKKNDIRLVGELCELDEKKARAIKGLGKVSLEAIRRALWTLDKLSMSMSITGVFPNFPQECARRKTEISE